MGWILAGIGLIALGVILLVDQLGQWDAGGVISQWWPAIIIALGLSQLSSRPRPWLGSSIIVGIGAVLLVQQLGLLPEDTWQYLWPSLIILAGVWIIAAYWRRKRRTVTAAESVTVFAVFGDARSASNAAAFSDGTVTAIFGEAELDLRDARLAPGGAEVAATAIFGDSRLVLPEGWEVELSTLPLLGDVQDKRKREEPVADGAPRLRVRAVAILGDVELQGR